jgi:hypothetical protein
MNAPRFWKECLTGTGQDATFFVAAFPIVNEINGALLTFNIFKKEPFLPPLCSMPIQVVKGDGGDGLVCLLQIFKF